MNQLTKNISWMTVGNVAVKPIWFVFITYVCIRYMGLAQYGSMTAALALMSICDGSLTLGSSQYTTRELARSKDRSDLFFSNFLVSRTFFSVLAIAIGVSIKWVIGPNSGIELVLFAGTYVLARNVLEYCRALFRAHEIFRYEAYSTILEKIFVVSFGWLALYYSPTASSALLGMSAGMLVTFLLNFGWVSAKIARFRLVHISLASFKTTLPKAAPLGLASIFVLLYYRTDSIMIEVFEGELVTGQYGIAFRVTEAMILLPYIVTSVLLPRLSTLYESSRAEFRILAKRSALGMGGLSLIAGSAVYFLAPFIVALIDGHAEAKPAVFLLQILVFSFVLGAINQIMITILTASNRQNRLAAILGLAAVTNIGLNLYFIPIYSATGAAAATVATQVVIMLLFLLTLARNSPESTD